MQKYVRICAMLESINQGRAPGVEDFCRKFEIAPRTVHEDIRVMREDMGLEIEFDRYRNGYINKEPSKKLPVFDLTEGELFALTLGRDMLAQYSGTVFEAELEGALSKITARLPNTVQVNFGDLKSLIKFRPAGIPLIDRKTFFDVNKACEVEFSLQISYFAARTGELTQRKIDPYKLVERHGVWYVISWCHLRNEMRNFALHRIREYKMLEDERFRHREDVDIEKYLANAFQIEHGDGDLPIKIKFNAIATRYIIERKWHDTQVLTPHDDGTCTLEFVSQSLDEVKRWVLYYGANAEVLAPESLRKAVQKEIAAALAVYQV
jgi:predicted DNA-binding transcriptional regulator YafY